MYIIFIFLMLFVIYLSLYMRAKYSQKRIRQMTTEEKKKQLSSLCEPHGFSYQDSQDVFITRHDAWQRSFGYSEFYDLAAPSLGMAFQCEPVYFNYQGKTWLVEFWKGQYGIKTGAEAGIYCADSTIPPLLRRQTVFQAASPEEMLPLKLCLRDNQRHLFTISNTHWWLGGFRMGTCCLPEDLSLDISITFPTSEMLDVFTRALKAINYKESSLTLDNLTIHFTFAEPKSVRRIPWDPWVMSYVLWKSHLFCRLYLWFTKKFSWQTDRLLYLYYLLPPLFHRLVGIRRFSRRWGRNA